PHTKVDDLCALARGVQGARPRDRRGVPRVLRASLSRHDLPRGQGSLRRRPRLRDRDRGRRGGGLGWGAEEGRMSVTTAFDFEGYRIVANRGVVRGITVRSRSVIGNLGASLQTIFGGNISLYTELCEHAREEAFELMLQHASRLGANAIIGMRY